MLVLSSSALAREKETLRKELDKTKLKLKDTESKLRNTIQDKTKLEVDNSFASYSSISSLLACSVAYWRIPHDNIFYAE